MQANNGKAYTLRAMLVMAMLLGSFGCGPPASQSDPSTSGNIPEITDELIYERINDAWIADVPEENGIAGPISWNFDHDEPKEIVVVDKQVNGTKATIVVDVKTSSSPRARANRRLAGQIRTEWQLKTGWVLRRWEIVRTENISMKYKDLPGTPPQNSNGSGPPPPPRQ